MLKWAEFKRYIVFTLSVTCAAALTSIAFPFYYTSVGSIFSSLLTGSTVGPAQTLVVCSFVHKSLFLYYLNLFGWILPFVFYPLGHYIYSLGARKDTQNIPQVYIASRNLIYLLVWTWLYFLCSYTSTQTWQISNKIESNEEFVLCDTCQKVHGREKKHSCDTSEEDKKKIASKKGSQVLLYTFLFMIPTGFVYRMISETFPEANIAFVIIVYAVGMGAVVFGVRNVRIEYDIPSLLFYTWVLSFLPITFYHIYAFGETVGVNIASFALSLWSLGCVFIFARFASKVTTNEETTLFLFPIVFAVDLTQALFYLSDTVSLQTFEFWALIVIQETQSILFNTGLKNVVIHKILLFSGQAQDEDNPFRNPSQLALIVAKANLDTLSEQLSIIVIIVVIFVGSLALHFGATIECPWCGLAQPTTFIPVFAVVLGVKMIVLILEHNLLHCFMRKWSGDSKPSFDAFYVSKSRDENSSLILLTVLSIGSMIQVLSNTG